MLLHPRPQILPATPRAPRIIHRTILHRTILREKIDPLADGWPRQSAIRRMDLPTVPRVESDHHQGAIAELREGDRTSYRRGW